MKLSEFLESSFFQRSKTYLLTTITGILILGLAAEFLADLLKGASGVFFSAILRTLVFVFHSYVEMIHKSIGEGQGDELVKVIYITLFTFSGVSVCWVLVWGIKRAKNAHDEAGRLRYKIKELALREESIETMRALKEEIAGEETAGDGGAETAEELRKSLDALKEAAKRLQPLEANTKSISELVEESEHAIKKTKKLKRDIYFLSAAVLLVVMYMGATLAGVLYTHEASVFVERSIEILAPTIPPERVLQLRAKYRSVDSAQKFYDLQDELTTIAKEKNVTLPQFRAIKR